MNLQRLFFSLFFLGLLAASPCAVAEPRTALVIGNAAYSFGALANAVNDARDIAEVLGRAGFDVTLETNADQRTVNEAIRVFGDTLKAKGGVGLFYFSGHGVQLNGGNYIVPIGEGLNNERDLKYRAVNAGEVIDAMAGANNGLNIVILDACRNSPFTATSRSAARGLARLDSTSGTFISFSTSPGAIALDGDGRNSPYTKHLVASIGTPDLTIEETFKRTLKGVYQETGGQQTPWISSSFFGDFIFRPTGPAAPSVVPPPPQIASRETPPRDASPRLATGEVPALGGVYRADGTNPNGSRYRGMVSLTPRGKEYNFRWWIGSQVFNGTGRFAGRMLVVDWGQKSPVIYTLKLANRLDGEWADGQATENLELFARAAPGTIPTPGGRYRVSGRNPNGSSYSGAATIAAEGGGRYRMEWRTGSTSYRGTGAVDGNLLTVNWGSATPVVYALAADGSLSGLWDAGRAQETLFPDR